MKTSSYPEITDELLSAYIDNAVSETERALIEQAVREDTTVAWRLATLRETVSLLRAMPVLPAPRSFTLTKEQLGQPALVPGVMTVEPRSAPAMRPPQPAAQPGRWATLLERWRGFWQAGSPVWRNAMAASMALLLVMVVAPAFLDVRRQSDQMAAAPAALVYEAAPRMEAPAATPEMASPGEVAAFAAPDTAVAVESAAPAELAIIPENQTESAPAAAMDNAVGAAAPLAQPTVMAGARIIAPSTREDDPLNPQPPVEDMASTGIAAAEIMQAAPVLAAPMPDAALQSPVTAMAEEPSAKAFDSPMEAAPTPIDLTTSGEALASTPADSSELLSAPATVAESAAATETPVDQPAAAEPTSAAVAPSARQAEERAEAAAPPAQVVVTAEPVRLWLWLQLALLGATFVFALLWLRSRRAV